MASESSVDSMWMDNLEEWVGDQNEVVTVKSLSRGLKVRNTLYASTARSCICEAIGFKANSHSYFL